MSPPPKKAIVEENAGYLTVMRTGKYTQQFLSENLGRRMRPKFTPEDLKSHR